MQGVLYCLHSSLFTEKSPGYFLSLSNDVKLYRTGSTGTHGRSVLADGVGTKYEGSHYVEQGHWERNSELMVLFVNCAHAASGI